jgi:hypothetical protein
MGHIKIRTQEQRCLTVPIISGILAGLGALLYLFLIPADPKNSIILGFSLPRLIEAGGILTGVLALGWLCLITFTSPDRTARIIDFLGWHNETPWSLAASWTGVLLGLFGFFCIGQVFPGQELVFERLLPAVAFVETLCLFFTAANLGFNSLVPIGRKLRYLAVVSLVIVAAGILTGLLIFPAKIGLMLRQGSLLALLFISPVLYLSFKRCDLRGDIAALMILAVVFGGAIIGVWTSGISDLNMVAGLLPYNDANGYYHGARLLSEGQTLHPFSAKRPVFPAVLGVLYTIGGQNLQFAIGCLVLISLLSIYFAAREVNHTSGGVCAAFFAFALFLFIRRFIGSVMSETLGLPLGVIGFGLLWSGANRKRELDVYAGIFFLCLGLIARAGPLFMLPFLIIWAGWIFRGEKRFSWKAAGFAALAALLGYGVHLTIFKLFAGTNSSSMGNFSYTFYGLVVGGKGWKQYMIDHPDVLALVEPAQSQTIYRYAFEALKADPMGVVRGALAYWRAFFTLEWYGMFGYVEGISPIENLIGRLLMAILTAVGLIAAILDLKKPANSMLLAGWVGIFCSIPFVPTLDAEIRTYAASIPWFAALAMTGLWVILFRLRLVKRTHHGDAHLSGAPIGLIIFAAATALLVFVGPLTELAMVKQASIPNVSGCQGESSRIVTTISHGSYINVRDNNAMHQSMVPDLRFADFNISIHNSPVYSVALQLFPVQAGDSFFIGYDRVGKRFENILGKTRQFEAFQGLVELCGWRDEDPTEYGFFHVESIHQLQK